MLIEHSLSREGWFVHINQDTSPENVNDFLKYLSFETEERSLLNTLLSN